MIDNPFYLLIAEMVYAGAEVVQFAEVLNLLLLDPIGGTWKNKSEKWRVLVNDCCFCYLCRFVEPEEFPKCS